jgi:hypothetical protein
LIDPLIADVVVPLLAALEGTDRQRANVVIARWSQDPDEWVRRAAALTADMTARTV